MPPLYAHDPFLAIQHLLSAAWLDAPMAIASVSCEGWAIALAAAAFLLSRERGARRTLGAAIPVAAGLLLAGITVQLAKRIVDVPRPLAVLGPAAVHVVLEPLRAHAFPSGHAASAAALAAWGLRRHGRAAWPLAVLALVGGLSRVYVGAHWTLDVLAGWAIGIVAALAADAAWARRRVRAPQPAPAPSYPNLPVA